MEGIYYKDGVYVTAGLDDNDERGDDFCVVGDGRTRTELYGRRVEVEIWFGKGEMSIDDIPIIETEMKRIRRKEHLSPSTIAAHLNAIEVYGVDAFLENYKQGVELFYGELKDYCHKTELLLSSEQEESNIKKILTELNQIRNLFYSVLSVFFALKTHMIAGLENEKVMTVYQSITDLLA